MQCPHFYVFTKGLACSQFYKTAVSSYLKDYFASAGEHVLSTYRAIAFQIALNTTMLILQLNYHTYIAFFAMEEVLSQSFSLSTYAALIAMIYWLFRVIIPKFACVTIVMSYRFMTSSTDLSCWLYFWAKHAKHILGFSSKDDFILELIILLKNCSCCSLPDQIVIFYIVMTESASIPFSTAVGL